MDYAILAKDLVVGYVARHDIPEKQNMQKIAEHLIEFYKITKAELDKANLNAPIAPIGFVNRLVDLKPSSDDQA